MEEKSETVTTPENLDSAVVDSNQVVNGNKAVVAAKNTNSSKNFNVKNKKLNNRRRKRSFRSRKNSRSGQKFKFSRNMLKDDQFRRHQLFFTDSQRLVPYNTNEFLMEDHYPKISPNFNYNPSNSHDSFSSSECGMSGSIDGDEFLTKEFRMDYENLRSEQLHDMTKEQLIQEYVKLENQTEMSIKSKENEISTLNNKIKELKRRLKRNKSSPQKQLEGDDEFSSRSDSSSSDSDSDSSSSGSSSSSSDSEIENNDFPVITDAMEQPPAPIAETVSC